MRQWHFFRMLYRQAKWPIIWSLINSILIYIIYLFLAAASVKDVVLQLLIAGYLVVFGGKIVGAVINRGRFRLKTDFLFLGFICAWTLWIVQLLLNKADNMPQVFFFLALGTSIYLVRFLFRLISPNNPTLFVTAIILLLLFVLFNTGADMATDVEGNATDLKSSTSLLGGIKNLWKNLKISLNTCPQLDVPLQGAIQNNQGITKMIFIDTNKYEDWTIKTIQMSSLNIPMYFSSGVPCVKGKVEGQNMNYWYCGALSGTGMLGMSTSSEVPYVEKVVIKPDGTIGETIRKGFRNVYSQEGEFVRTDCFEDPVAANEKNIEGFAKWLINS